MSSSRNINQTSVGRINRELRHFWFKLREAIDGEKKRGCGDYKEGV